MRIGKPVCLIIGVKRKTLGAKWARPQTCLRPRFQERIILNLFYILLVLAQQDREDFKQEIGALLLEALGRWNWFL